MTSTANIDTVIESLKTFLVKQFLRPFEHFHSSFAFHSRSRSISRAAAGDDKLSSGRSDVDQNKLHLATRIEEADWLKSRLRSFGSGVAAVVPDGFPAYTRILHPARGRNNEPIRWADVAQQSDGKMHRLVQFHALRSKIANNGPKAGNLPPEPLRILCAALAEHTGTPDTCYFCLWHGYGWLHDSGHSSLAFTRIAAEESSEATPGVIAEPLSLSPVLRAAVRGESRVKLPQRDYLLFEGPLAAAGELGWCMPHGHFVAQSPNLFWPRDHAWCVASEIDLFCTLVASTNDLAEKLIAESRLEAWRVFADDPVSADSDDENT